MNYQDALNRRELFLPLIGHEIVYLGERYLVKDVVIFTIGMEPIFLNDYNESDYNWEVAVNRYVTRNDLEVFLFCENLTTHSDALVPALDEFLELI